MANLCKLLQKSSTDKFTSPLVSQIIFHILFLTREIGEKEACEVILENGAVSTFSTIVQELETNKPLKIVMLVSCCTYVFYRMLHTFQTNLDNLSIVEEIVKGLPGIMSNITGMFDQNFDMLGKIIAHILLAEVYNKEVITLIENGTILRYSTLVGMRFKDKDLNAKMLSCWLAVVSSIIRKCDLPRTLLPEIRSVFPGSQELD